MSYEEFSRWYKSYSFLFEVEAGLPPSGLSPPPWPPSPGPAWSSLWAGFCSPLSPSPSPRDLSLLCRLFVPRAALYDGFQSSVLGSIEGGVDDWDGLFQTLLEVASEASEPRDRARGPEEGEEGGRSYQVLASLDLLALKAAFLRVAQEGVRAVLDDYSLPDSFKAIPPLPLPLPLSLPLSAPVDLTLGAESEGGQGEGPEGQQESFSYAGLLFTLSACPATEEDYRNDPVRLSWLAASDLVLHKLCGHEDRCQQVVQAAVEDMLLEDTLTRRGQTDDGAVRRLHVCLSTVVDYAGFRVSVLCPCEALGDLTSSLVLGLGTDGQTQQSVALDTSADARISVRKLAARLNLACGPTLTQAAPSEGLEWTEADEVPEAVLLSSDLKVHSVLMEDLTAQGQADTAG